MSVAIVNSTTVTGFIDDTVTFDSYIGECFTRMDTDGDGVLSRDEISGGFGKLLPLGYDSEPQQHIESLCGLVFERFDEDRNGSIDRKEFKCLMTEIMNAIARGIGGSPIIVVLEKDSFLMKAVQHELARNR